MITLLLVIFNYICCTNVETPSALASPYPINKPDKTFNMPNILTEISGLSLSGDSKYLVALQDENGTIFYLDKSTGKIIKEINFGKKDDYEGVEMVGKEVFAITSAGTIYRIGNEEKDIEAINIGLSSKNDVEGLAYDAKNNRLLIACKGDMINNNTDKPAKAIYAYDLSDKKRCEAPVYTITLQGIQAYLQQTPDFAGKDKLLKSFSASNKKLNFAPSSISVHPKTGELYILSSTGKLMLLLNPAGKIINMIPLNNNLHQQPEGSCFDEDGTFYIANEGTKKAPGKIYVFNAK